MRRYQTPGERELKPRETVSRFEAAGFHARSRCYDFASTPAGRTAAVVGLWISPGAFVRRGVDSHSANERDREQLRADRAKMKAQSAQPARGVVRV
jgi:hypothetical protein